MIKAIFFLIAIWPITICAQSNHADSLLNLIESLDDTELRKKGVAHYKLSRHYLDLNEDDQSLFHINQCLICFKQLEDHKLVAAAYNQKGNVVSKSSEYETSINYYDSALWSARRAKNDTIIAMFLNNLSLEYHAIGEYEKSVDLQFEALRLKEKIGASDQSISSTLLNIGQSYQTLEKYTDAMNYYRRCLDLKLTLQDSMGVARVCNNIAALHKNMEAYDSSFYYLNLSQSYMTHEDINLVGNNHTLLSHLSKEFGDTVKAIDHMQKALKLAIEEGSLSRQADAYQNLGYLYYSQKNYEKSISHYRDGLKLADQTKSWSEWYELHSHISAAYEQLDSFELAFHHLTLGRAYQDSLFSLESTKAIETIKEQYEGEKKERTIAEQRVVLARNEIKIEQKQRFIAYLIGGILVIICLSILIVVMVRNRQKRRQIILSVQLKEYASEMELLRSQVNQSLEQSLTKVPIHISNDDINRYLVDPLSERELEVLQHVAAGKSNKAIAEAIFISTNTVKFHLKNIYVKLDAQNRTEALSKASAMKILK